MIDTVKRGFSRPERILTRAISRFNHWRNKCAWNPDGVDLIKEDWDTLIILDACRYDYYLEVADLPGKIRSITSRGSTSTEFMRGNFTGKELHDVVYVSANGFYGRLREEIQSDVFMHVQLYSREWRDEYGISTSPNTVTEQTLQVLEEHPDKRFIVHYLQPHQPYLGEFGRKTFDFGGDLRDTIQRSNATVEEVRKAYRENLQLVIDEVKDLLDQIDGKTVITADHGEMLGERIGPFRYFGHFDGVYRDELVKVPWQTIESGERRTIIEEEPINEGGAIDDNEIEEQLQALGYKV